MVHPRVHRLLVSEEFIESHGPFAAGYLRFYVLILLVGLVEHFGVKIRVAAEMILRLAALGQNLLIDILVEACPLREGDLQARLRVKILKEFGR